MKTCLLKDLFVQEIAKVDDRVMQYGLASDGLVTTLHLGGAPPLGSVIELTTRTILFLTVIVQDVKRPVVGLVTARAILSEDVAVPVYVSEQTPQVLCVHFTDILFLDS